MGASLNYPSANQLVIGPPSLVTISDRAIAILGIAPRWLSLCTRHGLELESGSPYDSWQHQPLYPNRDERFREGVRSLTDRNRSQNLKQRIAQVNKYQCGSMPYFRIVETPSVLSTLEGWVRRSSGHAAGNSGRIYGRA